MGTLEEMIEEFHERIRRIGSRSTTEYLEVMGYESKILERFKEEGLIHSSLFDDFLKLKNKFAQRVVDLDNTVDELRKQKKILNQELFGGRLCP